MTRGNETTETKENREIELRSFTNDLSHSKTESIKNSWYNIIKQLFGCDTEVIGLEDDSTAQFNFGADVLIITNKGRRYSMELKTRRSEYYKSPFYTIEIAHHRYADADCKQKISTLAGWLYQSTADIVLFGTLSENKARIIEVCGFTLIPFKTEEFKSEFNNLKNAWAKTIFRNGTYQLTLNKLVSIEFLKDNALHFWYLGDDING